MTRGLLAAVAEKALRHEEDVVLHALSVFCGAAAVEASSEELGAAIFRARARAWFARQGSDPGTPPC